MKQHIRILQFLVVLPLFAALAAAGPGDWQFRDSVSGPVWAPIRVTAGSNGSLYVSNAGGTTAAFKSSDNFALTAAPTYTTVVANGTATNGIQGLAVDGDGSFYALWTGMAAGDDRLYKFDAAGNPVTAFGVNGIVSVAARVTGITLLSDGTIIAAGLLGSAYAYDKTSGALVGTSVFPVPTGATHVRDIAADSADNLYVNASGHLYKISGGDKDHLTSYTVVADWAPGVTHTSTSWQVAAGVCYFAGDDVLAYVNRTDNKVYVINRADGALVQELANPSINQPSDVACWQAEGWDYLAVTNANTSYISVFRKPNASLTAGLIDSADYLAYSVGLNAGMQNAADSAALEIDTADKTQGAGSLKATYTFGADAAWYKNLRIERAVSGSPADLSAMSTFSFDYKVDVTDGLQNLTVNLIDTQGYQTRLNSPDLLDAPTAGWQTATYHISDFQKAIWAGSGRFVNLKKISRFAYNIGNDGNTTTNTLVVKFDNVRFSTGAEQFNEVVLEDFESYADNAALSAAWPGRFTPATRITTTTLETVNPAGGAQSMNLAFDIDLANTTYGVSKTFSPALDLSGAKYLKLSLYGDANLPTTIGPIAFVYLQDSTGSQCYGLIYNWPANAEWQVILMPFAEAGVIPFINVGWTYASDGNSAWREVQWDGGTWDTTTDLSDITSIALAFSYGGAGNPPLSTLKFDNLIAGYSLVPASVPGWELY